MIFNGKMYVNVAKSTIHGSCGPMGHGLLVDFRKKSIRLKIRCLNSFQKVSVSCKALLVSTWLPSIKSGGG